jgi:hypothetical protein
VSVGRAGTATLLPAGSLVLKAVITGPQRSVAQVDLGNVTVVSMPAVADSPECVIVSKLASFLQPLRAAHATVDARAAVGALAAQLNAAAALGVETNVEGCASAAASLLGLSPTAPAPNRSLVRRAIRAELLAALDEATTAQSFLGSADGAWTIVRQCARP